MPNETSQQPSYVRKSRPDQKKKNKTIDISHTNRKNRTKKLYKSNIQLYKYAPDHFRQTYEITDIVRTLTRENTKKKKNADGKIQINVEKRKILNVSIN